MGISCRNCSTNFDERVYLIIICKTIKEFETTIIQWCEPQLYDMCIAYSDRVADTENTEFGMGRICVSVGIIDCTHP